MKIHSYYKCESCGWRADVIYNPFEAPFNIVLTGIVDEHNRTTSYCKELVLRTVLD